MQAGCLHLAVIFGNLEAIEYFMEVRISPHKCYHFHTPALAISLHKGYAEIVRRMLASSRIEPREDSWYTEVFSALDYLSAVGFWTSSIQTKVGSTRSDSETAVGLGTSLQCSS